MASGDTFPLRALMKFSPPLNQRDSRVLLVVVPVEAAYIPLVRISVHATVIVESQITSHFVRVFIKQ